MGSSPPPGNRSTPTDRLDGWKDIAAYIGRGVRTAQRWERELGLPVRRLNTGGGEVAFALKSEIDAWLLTQSRSSLAPHATDDSTPGRNGDEQRPFTNPLPQIPVPQPPLNWLRHNWVTAALVLAVVLMSAAAAWRSLMPAPAGPVADRPSSSATRIEPADIELVGSTLSVLGPHREALWSPVFAVPFTEHGNSFLRLEAVAVRDFDGDGHNEVLIARQAFQDEAVYCFNSDGTLRFRNVATRQIRFGSVRCPPLGFNRVFAEDRPRFPGTFWASGHHTKDFPSVIQRLDAQGKVRSEYWNNGFINTVGTFSLGGRLATLVGGINNETKSASLAVFFEDVNGSAPALSADYRCEGCPAGGPDIFLVFPRSRLHQETSLMGQVQNVVRVSDDEISVAVAVGGQLGIDEHVGLVYYTLDDRCRIVRAELGSGFEPMQRQLEMQKKVTAATRFRGERDFYPVRRWNGTGYDLITGPAR